MFVTFSFYETKQLTGTISYRRPINTFLSVYTRTNKVIPLNNSEKLPLIPRDYLIKLL
jgi:hypothetical protein